MLENYTAKLALRKLSQKLKENQYWNWEAFPEQIENNNETISQYTTPSHIPTFIENLDICENGQSLSFVQMRADFQTEVWLSLEHCVAINNKFPTFEKLFQNIIASQSKTEMKANITTFLNQKVTIIAKSNNNQLQD